METKFGMRRHNISPRDRMASSRFLTRKIAATVLTGLAIGGGVSACGNNTVTTTGETTQSLDDRIEQGLNQINPTPPAPSPAPAPAPPPENTAPAPNSGGLTQAQQEQLFLQEQNNNMTRIQAEPPCDDSYNGCAP